MYFDLWQLHMRLSHLSFYGALKFFWVIANKARHIFLFIWSISNLVQGHLEYLSKITNRKKIAFFYFSLFVSVILALH